MMSRCILGRDYYFYKGIIMKHTTILSIATFQAYLLCLVGLLLGILYSFGGLLIDTLVSIGSINSVTAGTPGLSYGTLLAFGALIGMPVIGALLGFVLGVVEGILYRTAKKIVPAVDKMFTNN